MWQQSKCRCRTRSSASAFIDETAKKEDFAKLSDLSPPQLAELSNGLNLVNLNVVLQQAARSNRRLDLARFRQLKKTMIERQCQGLVEFVEPHLTLDLVSDTKMH